VEESRSPETPYALLLTPNAAGEKVGENGLSNNLFDVRDQIAFVTFNRPE